MRHGKRIAKLGMPSVRRMKMLNNLATFLFKHERISTTLARAKALVPYANKIINLAKRGTPVAIKKVDERITMPTVRTKVKEELVKRFANNTQGARMINCGQRPTDCAPSAMVELAGNPFSVFEAMKKKEDARKKLLSYPPKYVASNKPLLK